MLRLIDVESKNITPLSIISSYIMTGILNLRFNYLYVLPDLKTSSEIGPGFI